MRRVVFIGTLILWCATVVAAPLERVLTVSVNVVANQSSAQLEIVAPRTDFLVVYLSSLGTFQPLDIPFSVHQIDGASHAYELTLAQLNGQCAAPGMPVSALTLTAALDGKSFNTSSVVRGMADPEQAHVLTLTFPNIPQALTSQACDGVVGVVAAVAF